LAYLNSYALTMTVSQREMTMRRRVKKVIEKTKAKVPFMEETGVSRPRPQSPCEAHRGNVMSALRFLRAPMAVWMQKPYSGKYKHMGV
jgi:hypothetical protein